jgi:hypothetical protein
MSRAQEVCQELRALGFRYVRTGHHDYLWQLGPFRVTVFKQLDAALAARTRAQARKMASLFYGPGVELPAGPDHVPLDPEEVVLEHGRQTLGDHFGMPQARRVLRRFGTVSAARKFLSDVSFRVQSRDAMTT